MTEYQLELLLESREDRLEREVKTLREQCDKVRKSQFAKISELKKLNDETRYELETIKMALCKYGDKHFIEYL